VDAGWAGVMTCPKKFGGVPAVTGGKVFSFPLSPNSVLEGTTLKSRKVNGVDCGPGCFAYIGDPDDPKTWLFCVRVLGDTNKTINAVKTALHNFERQSKHLGTAERRKIFQRLVGACIALGILVERDRVIEVSELEVDTILAERRANDMVSRISMEWGTQ
jgi:hypothetical protein